MATKRIGISRDLIFHPGETIAEVLIERGISQAELATRAGVSAAYVSNVIAGKKDISSNFAMGLEYTLDIPKLFWLNLQANYEAELLELNEVASIKEEERNVREQLKEVVKILRQWGKIPERESKDDSILSLRRALQISNLENLKDVVPAGAFRMASTQKVNPHILGAWLRICQLIGEKSSVSTKFENVKIDKLVVELKQLMLKNSDNLPEDLKELLGKYGIDFTFMRNFSGAPVNGYICEKDDGTYQMVLTIRGAFADIIWFSLFHELGHIVNGDIGKNAKFIDAGTDLDKEEAANLFASNALLEPRRYEAFVQNRNFTSDAIKQFSAQQNVPPYILIGRLQKEGHLSYTSYSDYKPRYKWAK